MSTVAAVALASELLRQALAISQLIGTAQAQNRELTSAELLAVIHRDDDARDALEEAIRRAETEGR